MAIDKKLQIFDDEGNPVDYDILASDVKFLPDGKDLPTKLAEMEEEIGEGGYAPPPGGIPATDLAPAVQQTLDDVANKVDKETGKSLMSDAEHTKLQNLPTAAELEQALANAGADVSVTTNQDGTFTIHVGDDDYTVNLNHTHENMAKLVVCEESDLPSTLDMGTIYAQVDNASSPTAIEKLWIAGCEFAGGGGSSVEPTLPTGYVECEYVQSSDPTIIVTGIAPVGSKWMLDLEASPTSGNQIFICSKADGGLFASVNSSGNFALGANNVLSSAAIRSEVWIEFITDGTIMKIGSDSTQRVNTSSPVEHHGSYVNLLGFNNDFKYVGKIYRIRCTKGGYFNGVPARETSSGDYGIYDLANGTFITGNFTGVVKQ